MNQLTLRGFDKELQRRIGELSRAKGISLNKAAIELLRKGAGLAGPEAAADAVGDSLDELIGSWSQEEERELLAALAVFEHVDPGFWDEDPSGH